MLKTVNQHPLLLIRPFLAPARLLRTPAWCTQNDARACPSIRSCPCPCSSLGSRPSRSRTPSSTTRGLHPHPLGVCERRVRSRTACLLMAPVVRAAPRHHLFLRPPVAHMRTVFPAPTRSRPLLPNNLHQRHKLLGPRAGQAGTSSRKSCPGRTFRRHR